MREYRPNNKASIGRLLIVLTIVLIVCIVGFITFKSSLKVNNILYKSDKIPEGFNNYKIVQISDIHNSTKGFTGKVKSIDPDIVIITGDIAYEKPNKSLENQLTELASLCPVYYVSGEIDTVDYSTYGLININDTSAMIEAPKISVEEYKEKYYSKEELSDSDLEKINEIVELSNLQYMQLIGIGNTEPNLIKEKVDKSIQIGSNCVTVCIMHHGEYFDSIKNLGLNLVLSGHSHGTMAYSNKYYKGSYSENGTTMFISSGVGKSENIPVGILSRPEISVITLNNDTSHDKNLLEKTLDTLIKDVGTQLDNNEIKEHTYSFEYGEEK